MTQVQFMRGVLRPEDFPTERLPIVLVAGRSNCGKSSFINAFFRDRSIARVSKTPGRTSELNFFLIGDSWMMVDLPGYGFAARAAATRAAWGGPIEALFADDRAALVLLLADIRRSPREEEEMLVRLARNNGVRVEVLLTKCDKVGRNEAAKLFSAWNERSLFSDNGPLAISSKSRQGMKEAEEAVAAAVAEWTRRERDS